MRPEIGSDYFNEISFSAETAMLDDNIESRFLFNTE